MLGAVEPRVVGLDDGVRHALEAVVEHHHDAGEHRTLAGLDAVANSDRVLVAHQAFPLTSGWPSNLAIISFISTTRSLRSAPFDMKLQRPVMLPNGNINTTMPVVRSSPFRSPFRNSSSVRMIAVIWAWYCSSTGPSPSFSGVCSNARCARRLASPIEVGSLHLERDQGDVDVMARASQLEMPGFGDCHLLSRPLRG